MAEKTINICRVLAEQFDFDKDYIDDGIKKFVKFIMVFDLTIEHICGKNLAELN